MRAKERLHRLALEVFRRLPERVQLAVVHTVAPMHSVGAMAVVRDASGALLLAQHTYKVGWGLPGGLVKRNEHPVHGVVREVREEVGLVIEVTGEPAVVIDPPTRRVDVIFPARVVQGTPREGRPSSPEIAEVAWFAMGALPSLQSEAAGALAALARLSPAG